MGEVLEFDVGPEPEPVTVRLRGVDADGGEWVEEFDAHSTPPARVARRITLAQHVTADGRELVNAAEVMAAMEELLLPGSRERFLDLIDDPDRFVDAGTVQKVLMALVERATGRPTRRPSGSAPPRSTSPATSAAAPALPELPPYPETSEESATSSTPRSSTSPAGRGRRSAR
jgi:hypothetical protein